MQCYNTVRVNDENLETIDKNSVIVLTKAQYGKILFPNSHYFHVLNGNGKIIKHKLPKCTQGTE